MSLSTSLKVQIMNVNVIENMGKLKDCNLPGLLNLSSSSGRMVKGGTCSNLMKDDKGGKKQR